MSNVASVVPQMPPEDLHSPPQPCSRSQVRQDHLDWMMERYDGKRCVFTQEVLTVWCHNLETRNEFLQKTLSELSLLPTDFQEGGYHNLFPSRFKRPFEDGVVGFLPNLNLLTYFILIEEGHFRFREDSISKGHGDPGRLPYSRFYGLFDASGQYYDAYFSRYSPELECVPRVRDRQWCYTASATPPGNDPFPRLKLYVSLTITIWVESDRLNGRFNSATAAAYVNVPLAAYLKRLWSALPGQRRILEFNRPHILPLPGVWLYPAPAPSFTLFPSTTATNRDPPDLFPSQFPAPTWTLPEFDYQEKPEVKAKGTRFVGMTTDEAVSRELVSRGMAGCVN
ncbi:hypothetical protein BT69DRAFT_1279936 [Atractiella rhizophila]|nr:hypothetical protein BT69DRAFT_1279936 [Atractiella rhizophila]